jgi:hypothetical protein
MSGIKLLLDDHRGIYIPQNFADEFKLELFGGINADDIETLKAGPDHEWYWEAWQSVLDNATFQEDGHEWRLLQDGALFAYCDELMTVEERQNFLDESEEESKRAVYERDDKLIMLDAPSAWASYLINGDASGLEDDEQRACDAWLKSEKLGAPVDCFDAGFCHSHDASGFALAGDCQTYVFFRTE